MFPELSDVSHVGCLPGEHSIIMMDNSAPPIVQAPRKVSVALKSRIETELARPNDQARCHQETRRNNRRS